MTSPRPTSPAADAARPTPPGPAPRPPIRRLFATLALGAVGGAVFFYFRLPLAWMLGAMVITTVAALAGRRLAVSGGLRAVMSTVLGVLLGSTFRPEVLDRITAWPVTMAALVVYLVVLTGLLFLYFRHVLGYDPVTAYFSAAPGGLNEMVITGAAMGGDDRTIALAHTARILLVVMAIPFWFRYTDGEAAVTGATGPSVIGAAPLDVAVMLVCAVAGLWIGKWLRLPAYRLVGPMLLSAGVHVAGLTESSPPWEVVAVAQVVIGSAVGARFSGVGLRRVLGTVGASLGATTLMLAVTVLFTLGLGAITGLDRAGILLAFSPGGLAEMSLIALSLGIETAFVATHHIVRIMLIVIAAPLLFRFARRRSGGARPPAR